MLTDILLAPFDLGRTPEFLRKPLELDVSGPGKAAAELILAVQGFLKFFGFSLSSVWSVHSCRRRHGTLARSCDLTLSAGPSKSAVWHLGGGPTTSQASQPRQSRPRQTRGTACKEKASSFVSGGGTARMAIVAGPVSAVLRSRNDTDGSSHF